MIMWWVVLSLIAFCLSCSGKQKGTDADQLDERGGGIVYLKNSAQPFTGTSVAYFPKGNLKSSIRYRNGKAHGTGSLWRENGKEAAVIEFRDGTITSQKRWNAKGDPVD